MPRNSRAQRTPQIVGCPRLRCRAAASLAGLLLIWRSGGAAPTLCAWVGLGRLVGWDRRASSVFLMGVGTERYNSSRSRADSHWSGHRVFRCF